jgi:hypothetical protein
MPFQVIGAFALGVIVGCNKEWIIKNYPFTNPMYPYYTPNNQKQNTTQGTQK